MSEFQEKHAVSRFLGAPAGYVGYEEGGGLVNKIRQIPYSVVLFDEIEKAHPDILDIFLQMLDEGTLKDNSQEKEGDFSNAIIICTSNVGSKWILQNHDKMDDKQLKKGAESILQEHGFRPEFLMRFDSIVPFKPITFEVAKLILQSKIKSFAKTWKLQGVDLQIANEAIDILTEKGYSKEFGARPLIGVIEQYITTPLADMLINNELSKSKPIKLLVEEGGLKLGQLDEEEK